jgi:2-methylisocitrate lyase-like PEP mutase family enzyme
VSPSSQEDKAAAFAALHAGAPFVIPNPWDVGSARVLEALGFRALATTSSGLAFALGRLDGGATLDEVCRHVASLERATGLPISADLENGYGPRPEDAADAIRRAAEAGAVGGSIEDWDPQGFVYEREQAVARVEAAAEAARGLGFPFLLTARAENHIRGHPDLEDTVARRISVGDALTWVAAKAFAEAATAIRDTGDLSALAARLPIDRWFTAG